MRVGAHKIQTVAGTRRRSWVDDSKATNPHAADAALRAFDVRVVWIAGGQAKGTTFDELITTHRQRLRGAVLLGIDRDIIAEALARHAPEVPTRFIESADTRAMAQAVAAAASLARPGDAVLLAPGCASKDMLPTTPHAGMPSPRPCVHSQRSGGQLATLTPHGHADPRDGRRAVFGARPRPRLAPRGAGPAADQLSPGTRVESPAADLGVC